PNKGKFGAVEQKLSGSWLKSVFGKLQGQALKLKMPKFEVKSKFSVKKMLKALGMEAPFDEGSADFTDIADKEQLFIDDVIHQ
ncbi:MAG: serpin family protein, partial [Bradymonadaceae bacterium]